MMGREGAVLRAIEGRDDGGPDTEAPHGEAGSRRAARLAVRARSCGCDRVGLRRKAGSFADRGTHDDTRAESLPGPVAEPHSRRAAVTVTVAEPVPRADREPAGPYRPAAVRSDPRARTDRSGRRTSERARSAAGGGVASSRPDARSADRSAARRDVLDGTAHRSGGAGTGRRLVRGSDPPRGLRAVHPR